MEEFSETLYLRMLSVGPCTEEGSKSLGVCNKDGGDAGDGEGGDGDGDDGDVMVEMVEMVGMGTVVEGMVVGTAVLVVTEVTVHW